MLKKAQDFIEMRREHAQGGEGYILSKPLLTLEEMGGNCNMFAQVTIPAGSSLGYHEHHGESETYYILSGEALYQDNEKQYTIKAGDVTFTPSGCGHGVINNTEKDLVFMALIIKEK